MTKRPCGGVSINDFFQRNLTISSADFFYTGLNMTQTSAMTLYIHPRDEHYVGHRSYYISPNNNHRLFLRKVTAKGTFFILFRQ